MDVIAEKEEIVMESMVGIEADMPVQNEINQGTIFGESTWVLS